MLAEVQTLNDQLEKLRVAGKVDADELISSAELVGDMRIIAKVLPGANRGLMVQLIDQVRKKFNPVAVLFATSPGEGEVLLSAGISRDLVDQGFNAGEWIGAVASVVGGKGGGKPDLAQAGGKNPEKIDDAMVAAIEFMKTKHSS
jgi:alanyl-tRNA synthetase